MKFDRLMEVIRVERRVRGRFGRTVGTVVAVLACIFSSSAFAAVQWGCVTVVTTMTAPSSFPSQIVVPPVNNRSVITGTMRTTGYDCSISNANAVGVLVPIGSLPQTLTGLHGLVITATGGRIGGYTTCKDMSGGAPILEANSTNNNYPQVHMADSYTSYSLGLSNGAGYRTCSTVFAETKYEITVLDTTKTYTGPTATSGITDAGTGVNDYKWGISRINDNTYVTYADMVSGFSTNFVASTCVASSPTLNLTPVIRTVLNSANATANSTAFPITVSGCTYSGLSYAISAAVSFAVPSGYTDRIANTAASPAANTNIQLLDGATVLANTGGNPATVSIGTVNSSSSSSFTKTLNARYISSAPAGVGLVQGIATYILTYQ